MKKIMVGIAVASLLASFSPAFAAGTKLDWQHELTSAKCNPVGAPVVNVVEKVKNDADSGMAGNYWAFDNYTREIKVWKTATAGTFCAIVKYDGEFKAIAGQRSPGNTGVLTGKEHGEMKGGRRATIVGSMLATPAWPTKGFVGVVDYRGDVNGNLPGYVSWLGQYFTPGYSYNDEWWGWIYKGEHSGTWVNAVSGSVGDILWVASNGKDERDEHERDD